VLCIKAEKLIALKTPSPNTPAASIELLKTNDIDNFLSVYS